MHGKQEKLKAAAGLAFDWILRQSSKYNSRLVMHAPRAEKDAFLCLLDMIDR